ncbi:hypothetical protein [Aquabacterium humicola]|uniref:hypothetical protein n=1 Tax=Aquabacterium humicola TaxID=3237377 RepID=UPI00254311A8|nr:hypothetical protein [Rubrivivax pictus]
MSAPADLGAPARRSAGHPWRLQHAWHGAADRGALALSRARLQACGIDLVDAQLAATADATKLHGAALLEAVQGTGRRPLELDEVACTGDWASRLPACVQRFMVSPAGRWHGIPLGIHRSNAVWVSSRIAGGIGAEPPEDFEALLRWLGAARAWTTAAPLAVGREPWQVGLLFESVLLAVSGPLAYFQALCRLDAAAWQGPAITRALDAMSALRDFTADEALDGPWQEQRARVVRGECALQVMGDWSSALSDEPLLEWPMPGRAGDFVAVVDFIVPWYGSDPQLAAAAARALSAPLQQRRFAQAKGCLPAFVDGTTGVAGLPGQAQVLPSLALEQCQPAAKAAALLAVLAEHFVDRRASRDTAAALAAVARHLS